MTTKWCNTCEHADYCRGKYDEYTIGCSRYEKAKPKPHWIAENPRPKSYKWICSECGNVVYDRPICAMRHMATKPPCGYKYCPYCGVKMCEVAE